MDFTKKIKENASKYGCLPFWSWNDKLEEQELREQIQNMKDISMSGFFMHARGGLLTEYCSEDWYNCVNICVDEAKKLGMEAWAYDENGWPSGFAGGKLLKDPKNLVAYLLADEGAFNPDAFAVYVLEDNKARRVFSDEGEKNYLNITKVYSPSYVDVMNKEIISAFIQETHEQYKKHVGEEFGKTMPGFFTDEPQYYRYHTAWSDTLPVLFEQKYGYSVFDVLPALFVEIDSAKEMRHDYWLLCHTLYTENFAKQIYDWCDQNGVQSTGHTIEEASLSFQMKCCGGAMPFYEYEHVPGIDHLGRHVGTDLSTKQIGSVAAQLNKKKVLTETFALCGWDVTPLELKRIAQWQYVAGVNVICAHLYPYSERGERKYDYPAHYSRHLPWNRYLADFNRFFANIGSAMSMGTENANVLLLHPIRTVSLYFKREDESCVAELEKNYLDIMTRFGDHQVQYHFGDESIMARHGSIEGTQLIIGSCRYDFVVLPLIETIDSSTACLLKKYVENGGKIYCEGPAPTQIDGRIADLSWLKQNTSFEEILAAREASLTLENKCLPQLRMNVRTTENGRIFYITNLTDQHLENVHFQVKACSGLTEIDMLSLKTLPVAFQKTADGIEAVLSFTDSQSYFLIEDANAAVKEAAPKPIPAGKISAQNFIFAQMPENCITLDFAQLSFDGITYDEVKYIKHIHEILLKRQYEGDAYLKFTFRAEEIPADLKVCIEPMKFKQITVNGHTIELSNDWRIQSCFKTADIAQYAHPGENDIILHFSYHQDPQVYKVLFQSVMESLRNCLSLTTEIEAIYLFGSFGISATDPFTYGERNSCLTNGGFTLTKQKPEINLTNIVTDLYPFYGGKIIVEKTFDAEEEGLYRMKIDGRYALCEVTVNDVPIKTLFFDRCCEAALKRGKNTIRLTLFNSLRNTFGPLHHQDPESFWTGPFNFTFEGTWGENSLAPEFRQRYAFIRFGIDDIELSKI